MNNSNKKFREELVKQITEVGLALSTNPANFIPDLEYVTDYTIDILFGINDRCAPEITLHCGTIPQAFIDRRNASIKEELENGKC